MDRKFLKTKICILGYGFTSLIAYKKLLEKYNHNDILILKDVSAKDILTLEIDSLIFSPLPIFPVLESDLYNSGLFENKEHKESIKVSYTEVTNFNLKKYEIKSKSLASFMVSNDSINKWFCLGLKQWGEDFLSKPFNQVQSKIKNHYLSKNGNTRIGYSDSLSQYYDVVKSLNPIVTKYREILNIDYKNSLLITDSKKIKYEKLISTIPIDKLLSFCNFNVTPDLDYFGSYFFYFRYSEGFNKNNLIYDCDFDSEILRIFSINDNFMMVQLKSIKSTGIDSTIIKNQILKLVPSIKNLKFSGELILPMSYPVEDIADKETLNAIENISKFNLIPFGRFGEWKYTDLHELNWKKIQ